MDATEYLLADRHVRAAERTVELLTLILKQLRHDAGMGSQNVATEKP